MNNKISGGQFIVLGNSLVEAEYKMSPLEAKLFFKLIGSIRKGDTSFLEQTFAVKELMEEFGIGERNYIELRDATRNLISRVAEIKTEYGILQASFLDTAVYYERGENRGNVNC